MTTERMPATTVNKVGGANMSKLDQVERLVRNLEGRGEKITLVVSAFQGVTDKLIGAMDQLSGTDYTEVDIDRAFEPVETLHRQTIDQFFKTGSTEVRSAYTREYEKLRLALMTHKQVSRILMPVQGSFAIRDQVIGFGEKMAGIFLELYLKQEGHDAQLVDNVKCNPDGLNEDGPISQERLHAAIQGGIRSALDALHASVGSTREKLIRILGGHVANTPHGMVPDIGRSYSDTTAVDVALAARGRGERVTATRFWKEVDGVMTGDPKDLDPAKNKPFVHRDVSLEEGLEMAAAGSLLMQVDALALAEANRLDLQLVNINNPEKEGTTFTHGHINTAHAFKVIIGNPYVDTVTITLPQMANRSGFGASITTIFARYGISFDGCFTEGTGMTFSIPLPKDKADQDAYRRRIRTAVQELESVTVEDETYTTAKVQWSQDSVASISVIGNEMANKVGIMSEITGVLGAFGINIRGIVHGEQQRRITILVDRDQRQLAIQKLHSIFVDSDTEVIADYMRRRVENLQRLTGSFK